MSVLQWIVLYLSIVTVVALSFVWWEISKFNESENEE